MIAKFNAICRDILLIAQRMLTCADRYYNCIVSNPLILTFILMVAIFIGCALIKRLVRL